MKYFIFLIVFLLTPYTSLANNFKENKEWYLSLKYIDSHSISPTYSLSVTATKDISNTKGDGLSFAIGRNFYESLRIEAEYTFLETASVLSSVDSQHKHNIFLLNVYKDFSINTKLSSYISLGLGGDLSTFSGIYTTHGKSDDPSYSSNSFLPVYGIGIGFSYALINNLCIDLGARILYSDSIIIEIDDTPITTIVSSSFPMQGQVGIRYAF